MMRLSNANTLPDFFDISLTLSVVKCPTIPTLMATFSGIRFARSLLGSSSETEKNTM